MKTLLFVLTLLLVFNTTKAQIGINTNNPDAGSVLEIFSETKGLLIPRFTTTDRESYKNSADAVTGALVFDSEQRKFYVFNDNNPLQWEMVGAWEISDNAIPGSIHTLNIIPTVGIVNISSNVKTFNIGTDVISTFLGDIKLQKDIYFDGTIKTDIILEAPYKFEGYGTIPIGGIIMWSGNPANLPTGWKLCDASGITYTAHDGVLRTVPDLSGRFIVSYGQNNTLYSGETQNTNYSIGPGSGLNQYRMSENESSLVRHLHTFSGSTENDGAHIHTLRMRNGTGNDGSYPETGDNSDAITYSTTAILSNGNHSHAFSGSTDPFLDKNVIYAKDPHENRPPYYALAFIIRIK